MARPKKNKLTREEILQRKRENEKKRQERIRNNPELLLQERLKWKNKYENRKAKGQVKLISEMTERERRLQKKAWRERQRKHREKIRQIEKNRKFIESNSPPDSDLDSTVSELAEPLQTDNIPEEKLTRSSKLNASISTPGSTTSLISNKNLNFEETTKTTKTDKRKLEGLRRKQRNRQQIRRKLEKYKLVIRQLQKRIARYKVRDFRKKQREENKKDLTPRKKLKKFIKNRKIDEDVSRRLLFSNVIEAQFNETFKTTKCVKEKNVLKQLLSGKIMKKYRFQSHMHLPTRFRLKRDSVFSQHARETVQVFLEEDSNSTLAPGKKDCITRKKLKKQKRYLNDSLRALHKKFTRQHADLKDLHYSTFCKLKPFWIVTPKINSRDTCLCITHHNMAMLVDKLHIYGVISEKNPDKLVKTLVCEPQSEICLSRGCKKCKDKVIVFAEFNAGDTFSFYKWVRIKEKRTVKGKEVVKMVTTKKEIITTIADAVDLLENDLKKYMIHLRNIEHQYLFVKNLKNNLSSEEMILHVDFSENYLCKYSREVQSFHFGGSRLPLSLHTGIAYLKKSEENVFKFSFSTLSTNTRHEPAAIWAHLNPVLCHLLKNYPKIKIVHFVSDSPSSQYRNWKNVYLLRFYMKEKFPTVTECTWNFTEQGHGKGAPDGIGGYLKRTADQIVAQGTDITSLLSFYTNLQESTKKIKLWLVNDSDIKKLDEFLKDKEILRPKGLMKLHQITCNYKSNQIDYRILSCGLCSPKERCPDYSICPPTEAMSCQGQGLLEGTSFTSTEENLPQWVNIQPGKFILVKFSSAGKSKASVYRYVCNVLAKDDEDGEIRIQGMRLKNDEGTEFVEQEDDVSCVPLESVIAVLPEPKIIWKNRLITYKFAKPIDVFEKV